MSIKDFKGRGAVLEVIFAAILQISAGSALGCVCGCVAHGSNLNRSATAQKSDFWWDAPHSPQSLGCEMVRALLTEPCQMMQRCLILSAAIEHGNQRDIVGDPTSCAILAIYIAKIGMKVHLVLGRVPRLLASVILSFAPLLTMRSLKSMADGFPYFT